MKRGYFIPVVLMILLIASAAWAQTTNPSPKTGVLSSVHNVGGLGCKSCHAAHDGAALVTTGASQATGQILLWDRSFTTQTFGTYTSPTMQNLTTEVGKTTPLAADARMNSFLCLSCHDGVTTPVVTTTSNIGSTTTSFGLTNDHPVNMTYDPTKDLSLAAASSVTTAGLTLPGNTVQCSSCHTSHDNSKTKFLRMTNTSALCTTCHP